MTESAAHDEERVQLEIHKGADAELRVGGLRFVACRREVGSIDGGISLYVWSDVPGDGRELLRVDLFRSRPHYHAPAEKQEETAIEVGAEADSVGWAIEALACRAPDLLREGGFDDLAGQIDTTALAASGEALQALFDGLGAPTEVSYFEVPKSVLDALNAS